MDQSKNPAANIDTVAGWCFSATGVRDQGQNEEDEDNFAYDWFKTLRGHGHWTRSLTINLFKNRISF